MSGRRTPARRSAASFVYERLRGDVVTGRLGPGSPLVEELLADRYGVSRTPIREALRRLEQEGLVQRVGRGLQVRGYTAEELYELYETRALLEGFAARRAAERHGPVDAARMERAHRRMAALDGCAEPETRIAANRDFHTAVWKAAGNRTVEEVLSRLHLHSVRHTTLLDPERWRRAVTEHGRVLEAILHRDADEAERSMVEHLETGRDVSLLLQLETDPA